MTNLESYFAKLEAADKSRTKGEWEFVDDEGNQFVISVVKRAKNPEDDKVKQICALAGFTARTKDFKFIALAANEMATLIAIAKEAVEGLKDAKWLDEQNGYSEGNADRVLARIEKLAGGQGE